MVQKIYKFNMHVPSAVHSQLFFFHYLWCLSYSIFTRRRSETSYKCSYSNCYAFVLITRTQWKTMKNCVIYWLKSKSKHGVHRTIYLFFKSYVECCIFLSIYELQLHEKKCIFIFHGSFCSLRFMELYFFWVLTTAVL